MIGKFVLRITVPTVFLAFMVIIGTYIYGTLGSKALTETPETEIEALPAVEQPQIQEEPEEVVIKISAVGDILLGREDRFPYENYLDDVLAKVEGDYGYFFANVAHILAGDDLTVANLESPLTRAAEKVGKYDYGRNFWFKGMPEYGGILVKGSIDAVSLANNHTYDYGPQGYEDTKSALNNYGIGYFGYDDFYETSVKGIKIGMTGFNELGMYDEGTDHETLAAAVKHKTELLKSNNDFVIAYFHWGEEYSYEPTANQKSLAYWAVDAGADLVVGAHPHVIQGVEQYKDRYIVYSLGNFCYAGNKNPRDKDTFIYQQEIVFNGDDKSIIEMKEPYYIPCYVSSVQDINNFQPTPAKGNDIVRILHKINELSTYKIDEAVIKERGRARLVNLKDFIPNLVIDLRYASTNNIVGKPLYTHNEALLRIETAEKLAKANEILNQQGLRLKLWDGYRPAAVQLQLWESAENKSYFAHPDKGSKHTRGCAVDVTLTDWDGNELEMPSDFDDLTDKANRNYTHATPTQKHNALLLEQAMKQAGFKSIFIEWWHFEDTDSDLYGLINEESEAIILEIKR